VYAVFHPARTRRRAAEVNPLHRIKDIVDGQQFVLAQNWNRRQSNYEHNHKALSHVYLLQGFLLNGFAWNQFLDERRQHGQHQSCEQGNPGEYREAFRKHRIVIAFE
jgi:hypothetical protein